VVADASEGVTRPDRAGRGGPAPDGARDEFLRTLRRETVVMARFRARLMAVIFVAAFPVSLALSYYASRTTGPEFTPFPTLSIAALLVALIGFEWLLVRRLERALAEDGNPSRWLAHVSGIVEMTFPTLLILAVEQGLDDPLLALGSAGPWAYFPFIVLATLYLDLWIAVASGVVAAVQYLIVAKVLVDSVLAQQGLLDAAPREVLMFFHVQKALMLVITGVIAGFVAREIRRRTLRSFEQARERQRILSVFGQLTAPEVVDELLHRGGDGTPERRHVSVLFLDVRGYSGFAESAPPEEVVDYLNRLFDYTIAHIHRRGGIVHQLLGDGLMAVFGVPVSRGEDTRRALDAALDILDGLDAFVQAEGLPPTRLAMGLHCGEAVVGLVGSPIHKEYKVTGDVVNVAARLEELCKLHDARLLCSAAVIDETGFEGADDLGPQPIRGREQPLRVYRVR